MYCICIFSQAIRHYCAPCLDYCVLMTEFIADGGDGYDMIPEGTKFRESLGGDLGFYKRS